MDYAMFYNDVASLILNVLYRTFVIIKNIEHVL